GIIHRDLKPSNILVTLHDGVPVPKVIDFGLAKATDQQLLTDKTLYTAFHQFVGTPAYMSPEQAEMSGLGIDTRTDVYALGVLLYELLTGSPPFESRTLLAAGVDEMRRIIREQEPPTPSTRLSTLRAGELDQTAGHRNTVAPRLVSLVRGDLDWIVMKALEKDRRRRYESAAALAREIEHHLRDEPVLARPPSAAYRLQKYVRRHRVLVATASMVGLTLLAGSVTSTWFAILEHRQRQRAGLSEMEARRSAYVSDMNLASQALGKNDLDRVRVLLDQHRPEPGGPDFRGWEWRYLWNASESDALFSVQAHEGAAYSVAFLTGGHQLASSGSDHTVALWDLESRQELRRWSCQSHPDDRGSVTALTLTPDGTLLLGRSAGFGTTGPWGTVLLGWRTADWTPDTPFRRLTEVTTIRVSPSGRLLAARNVSGKALLHDFATGRVLAELTGPSDRYAEIAFASGQPLVAAQAIDTIALWDTEKRVLLRQIPLEVPAGEYPCFAFTPDGAALAVGGSRPRVNVMGHPEASFSPMGVGPVSKLVFSPDGRRLVTVDAEGSVTVRNATDWSAERTLHGCLVRMISDMAISQDGRLLATTQGDGQVHVWNLVENPRRGDTLVALPSGLAGVAYSAGSAMACWWKDGRLRILGGIPELSQTDWQLPTTNRTVVAISPSGRLVCFRDDAGHIAIQDLPGAARVCTLRSEREIYPAGDQAFSPDESRLLTVEGAGTDYTLWEVQDGSAIGSFQTGARLAWWGADSRTLLVSAEEGRVLEI
ncbi:MAG: protein kinase, partial [Verrucomicrobiae bacterium]|nr:protein kinase [Verrucomicrobiae bacterium]